MESEACLDLAAADASAGGPGGLGGEVVGTGVHDDAAAHHGVVASASFYSDGAGIFRDTYSALTERPPDEGERARFLGGAELLTRTAREIPGGRLLIFELKPKTGGYRETLVVAAPATGDGLATLQLRYQFQPSTARMILRTIEQIVFSPGAG